MHGHIGTVIRNLACTHDTFGLGEEGPTQHQPVEHFIGLHAVPDLLFLRRAHPIMGLESSDPAPAHGPGAYWQADGSALGAILALGRYGASAPGALVTKELAFTSDQVAHAAKALLGVRVS